MSASIYDRAQEIVKRLGGTWHGNYGMCRCPAHDDRTPSLSVKVGDKAVLFHCFAGCSNADIMAALRGHQINVRSGGARGCVPKDKVYRELARNIWDEAHPIEGTLAEKYLRSRAIDPTGLEARFVARAQVGPKSDELYCPAMITPIEDERGLVSIQRTFLSADPIGKADMEEPKRCLGKIGGGVIRKGGVPTDGVLNLAEGYEDACSVSQLFDINCWAVCGIERYALLHIPDSIRLIFVFSQHGSEAAKAVENARGHLQAEGRNLGVILPYAADYDWNDLLRGRE